jgi:hypothetical protein
VVNISVIYTVWRKSHRGRDFFQLCHGFTQLCLMWTPEVLLWCQVNTCSVCASTFIKILFCHLTVSGFCFLLYCICFNLLCEITLSSQGNLFYKSDTQFKTKDAQLYFLMQSITRLLNWNSTSIPIKPTTICTRTVMITSTFSGRRFHWFVTSYALPDANKNSEKRMWNVESVKFCSRD